jgi:tetratricopeptide (TPR) repeat protein
MHCCELIHFFDLPLKKELFFSLPFFLYCPAFGTISLNIWFIKRTRNEMNTLHSYILITALLIGGACSSIYAQVDGIKLKLAQNYEQSGDWQKAIPLYEELYQKENTNIIFFDALRRGYIFVKRYSDAILLVKKRLEQYPNDVSLCAHLGSIYAKASQESLAVTAWKQGIALQPNDQNTYRTLANAALESRQWGASTNIFLNGRNTLHIPTLFAFDLASIYAVTMDFTNATKEYLLLLQETEQQLPVVQSRIASYTNKADGLKAATQVIRTASTEAQENVTLKKLYAWILMEAKDYAQALELYRALDILTKANGNELFHFAEHAFRDKEYITAALAYNDILQRYKNFPQILNVQFGLAHTIEELNEATDSVAQARSTLLPFKFNYETAIAIYNEVASKQPKTELAATCYLRIAVIQNVKYNDVQAAYNALTLLQQNVPLASPLRIGGKLLHAEIYIQEGDTIKAKELLNSIIAEKRINSSQKEIASYRIAEIAYFNGSFPEAIKQLEELTKLLSTDIANDALQLKLFIDANSKSEGYILKQFAAAEFLLRQKKRKEAVSAFHTIATKYISSALADDALLRAGNVQTQMQHFPEAIRTYQQLIETQKESLLRDRSLINIAHIYSHGLKQRNKAIETYELLLQQYPHSLFADEARKQIRILRGDTL